MQTGDKVKITAGPNRGRTGTVTEEQILGSRFVMVQIDREDPQPYKPEELQEV